MFSAFSFHFRGYITNIFNSQTGLCFSKKGFILDPRFLDLKGVLSELEMPQLPAPGNWPSQLCFQNAQVLVKVELLKASKSSVPFFRKG